jgi:uncharacterized protein (UPF0548 family)
MNLLWFRQSPRLDRWQSRGFTPEVLAGPRPRDNRDRHEGTVGVEPPGDPVADGPFERVVKAIMSYQIFPARMATPVVERTPLQLGDVLGLRYPMLPGLSIFFAAKVIEMIDDENETVIRKGFTYRTLEGHIEIGEETFLVEKNRLTGEVTASLQAWSRPGHWLTRVGYWYARWCQLDAGKKAIRNFQRLAVGESGTPRDDYRFRSWE